MAEARYIATTTRLTCPPAAPDCNWKGMVLVAGGENENYDTLSSAERYDPATETWSAAGALRFPRYWHQAVGLQDGRVLVVGGVTDSGSSTATAEIYNPATNTWSDAASMSADRYGHQLTLLSDGRVLASGGLAIDGSGVPQARATAEIYDPQQDQWQPAGSMTSPRGVAAAALLPDGRVLVAGGSNGTEYLSSAEIFDPSNLSQPWEAAPPMSVARYAHGAAVLPDGRVLMVGGTDVLPGAEIFDPAFGTWSPTANMYWGMYLGPRYFFQTIPLADGRVMVAGGIGSAWQMGVSVEMFDPALGLWVPDNTMRMARYLAGTAELLDGRILIAGGYAEDIYRGVGVTNAAETYLPCPPNAPPVAVCANQVVYIDPDATTCTAAAVSVDNGSYDPDNGPEPLMLWQTPAVGEPLPLGDTLATLVADDGDRAGVCQATITVVDNTSPPLGCPTTPEIVECQSPGNTASEGQGSATFENHVGTADNCSQVTPTAAAVRVNNDPGAPRVTVRALGSGIALGVNQTGRVSGASFVVPGNGRAVVWNPDGSVQDVGAFAADARSRGFDVNDEGTVAVASTLSDYTYPFHAFVWRAGAGMVDLGTPGGNLSRARSINASGQVVGDVEGGLAGATLWHADGTATSLGTLGGRRSAANDINDAGQVVGWAHTPDGRQHAFLWTSAGGMRDLGTLGGSVSVATGVNELGHVTGWSATADGRLHAFLWSPGAGMVDLDPEGNDTYAEAINDRDEVVGHHYPAESAIAFYWSSRTGMVELGTLGGGFSRAWDLNDDGIVVGESTDGRTPQIATVWTVSVMPAPYWFSGFLPPIPNDGSGVFRAGRALPVKFQLADGSAAAVTDAEATLRVFAVEQGDLVEVHVVAAGGSGAAFRYDADSDQYVLNLSTRALVAGEYLLRVELDDGSTHEVRIALR